VLSSPREVVRCLLTYSDWWQLTSSSIIQVGIARRSKTLSQGFKEGLLDTLDERTELSRRMALLDEKDRRLLFLWYVKQLPVSEIAPQIHLSRRQCARRRAKAIDSIVEYGDQAA
jgi:DNA-directed RNA polymerase specialized sigma subunit